MKNDFFELIDLSVNNNVIPSEYITNFIIFSSIEIPALQFSLEFNDKMDMRTVIPLKGGELLKLSVVDIYEQKVDLNFTVTKVTVVSQKESDAYVVLKAVSTNGLSLASQRIHASYEATPSEVVKAIAPFINVTPTIGSYPVNASGWSKSKLLRKLTQLAFNEKYKAMYVCYENLNGIHFKPMNELLSVKTVNSYKINDDNPHYRYNIIEWNETKAFDTSKQSTDGNYDNTYVHYNPDTKKIYSKQVNITDAATESASLGKGQSFVDQSESMGTKLVPFIMEAEDEFYPKAYNAMSFALYTKKMEAMMNGDLSVQVGGLINISMTDRYNKSEFANETAGLWFIEKMSYYFTPDEFKMKLQVTKNATYNGETTNGGLIVNPTVELN